MHDELTSGDIRKMKEELEELFSSVRPAVLEDLKTARAFGDLSENYEYKAAKQALRRCDSRIRYLQRMIATARVISDRSAGDAVGLNDSVTVVSRDDMEEETYRIVTTIRQDTLHGLISRESPMGKALLGHRRGDVVTVRVNDRISYAVEIKEIVKGADDDSIPIRRF